jgi:HK97 family phage prohead protease
VRSVEKDGKTRKVLTMVASTDRAVDWGGWREVLVHGKENISRDAAHAMLVNHDPNKIAGRITDIRVDGGKMEIDAELLADARMDSGVSVADAIDSGALRGVSIGYHYTESDADFDRESRTLTVNRWRLLEVSLTPIPADDSAGLRSLPDQFKRGASAPKEIPMKKFLAWLAVRGFLIEKLSDEQVEHLRGICDKKEEPEADYAKDARTAPVAADEKQRAEQIKRDREIAVRAESHGLKASDYLGMTDEKADSKMLRDLAEKNKTSTPDEAIVTVQRDAGDKIITHARASLYRMGGIAPTADEAKEFKVAGAATSTMPMRQILRAVARAAGFSNADYWSDAELAAQMAGSLDLRTLGRRDAPNKIVSNFSTLLANVAHKALQKGFESYNGATWQIWATVRDVPNFLQVTNTGLSSGRLIETAEGNAFPELLQKDGGYNSTLGLFGATVSVSFQAIVNDQLGQILRDLGRTGALAAMTVDRLVYSKLVGGTWTNDTSTSATLATPSNLDKPRAALKNKLSPANEKLGIVARYLLHDPANAVNAEVATGKIYGPGQTTSPSQGSKQIIPVESHWISDTALAGGALTTDYYLTGDPNVVDTVLVNFLEGVGQTPIIMPYDAGAVAAEKYKIMLPVQATMATHTDGAATPATRVSGMQKATVA